MNYEDEPYVRLYTRKTLTWKRLGWEGRAVRNAMLDGEFDAAGIFDIRGDAAECIAAVTDLPLEIVRVGLQRLIETETWVITPASIVWPSYEEAQNCRRSDRIRQRESRRARSAQSVTDVTARHRPSQHVTLPSVPPTPPTLPSTRERETCALDDSTPEVPGLVKLPGPLQPSKREQAQTQLLTEQGNPRFEYSPGWSPTKANQARGLELMLTEAEIWDRWETCKDKHYTAPFRSDVKQFNRELAFAAQDKRTQRFKSAREREAFENPGRERQRA